jgi:tetratricopeptide (TPR) repeat protein
LLRTSARAIALEPDWDAAHYNLANAYAELGKHNQAIEEYNKAIKLNAKNRGVAEERRERSQALVAAAKSLDS